MWCVYFISPTFDYFLLSSLLPCPFFPCFFLPLPSLTYAPTFISWSQHNHLSFFQKLYETLGVPHEPLTLIPPQFECPMPRLSPATFPPAMREPAPPALDQFDLDEHFAKEGIVWCVMECGLNCVVWYADLFFVYQRRIFLDVSSHFFFPFIFPSFSYTSPTLTYPHLLSPTFL